MLSATNKYMPALVAVIATFLVVSMCVRPTLAAAPNDHFLLFAGNGEAGLADGAAASAEFLLPSALAAGPDGNLYVTDAAAQRVRVVRADGSVRTLAGSGRLTSSGLWVSPGFRDGPALQAQFDRPSGIAVKDNRHIYVADTNNHCIRLIQAGIVSTYAGVCRTAGSTDGVRAQALFSFPRQLSLDLQGNLYVADFRNGVRRIDVNGVVSTLPLQVDKRVTGVQVATDGTLWVADVQGLLQYDPHSGSPKRILSSQWQHDQPQTAGDVPLGSPYALALGKDTEGTFYTDLRNDSVQRLLPSRYSPPFVAYLSGAPRDDAVLGNGYRTSTLHGPMGIALDDHGRLFVADSGHKRILQLTGFDRTRRIISNPLELLSLQPVHSEYRILVIGNSFVWFTSEWRDTIGALVEDDLRRDLALKSAGLTATVTSVEAGGGKGQASFAREIVARSKVDFVLVLANSYDLWSFEGKLQGGEQLPDATMATSFHNEEAETVKALKAASIKSMFVVIPDHTQVSPLESLYNENLYATEYNYASMEPVLIEQLQSIGAPVLDFFPLVRAYEKQRFTAPLYNNEDLHPSAAGRAFIASQIAKRLEELKPWNSRRKI